MANVNDNMQVFTAGMPSVEHCKNLKVGIVAAEWNDNIISPLMQGAIETLTEHGVCPENIFISHSVFNDSSLVWNSSLTVQNYEDTTTPFTFDYLFP